MNIFTRRFRRDALIEHHRDIAAERFLNFHGVLGGHQMMGAVEVRLKTRALLRDLAHRRQTKNLIAAAVRQDRSVPTHESV